MNHLVSTYQELGPIVLPEWKGRQKYMHSFNTEELKMHPGYEDYEPVVRHLCAMAGFNGVSHMTVDEKVVQPGMSQRRPGVHVDGRFTEEAHAWVHPPGGGGGFWAHYCNRIPVDRMAVIVASSVPGCVVYEGTFHGQPASDGDLSHIRSQLGTGKLLSGNKGFLLSPDCVHESLIFTKKTKRIFLRIALEDKNAQ